MVEPASERHCSHNTFATKWLGLDLILPSMLAEISQLGTALAIRHSRDPKMASLPKPSFKELVQTLSKKEELEKAKTAQLSTRLEKLDNLNVQSILFKALRSALTAAELTTWSKHLTLINPNIANFARKALVRCLPTNANMFLWGKAPSDTCPNCGARETENHVLNNCPVSAQQGRYTWRHNAVSKVILSHIKAHIRPEDVMFADLQDFKNPEELYTNILPDITVIQGQRAYILELTCCYEKNLESSKLYKLEKYGDPSRSCKKDYQFSVHMAEVTSLGFIPSSKPK